MKTLQLFTIIGLLLVGFCACSPEENNSGNNPSEPSICDFEIKILQSGNQLNVEIIPSINDQPYFFGILDEKEYQALGQNSEEGFINWANNLLSSPLCPELYSGQYSSEFTDLLWNREYCIFAAQIIENKVHGTPVLKAHKVYRASMTYSPQGAWIAPAYLSDNGDYVVGNYEGSFIYHLPTDSISFIQGTSLYDITDNGIAYGQDETGYPVRIENGELHFMELTYATSTEGSIFAVSPDGSLAAGYQFVDSWNIQPLYYRNNEIVELETGTDINGIPTAMACVKGIASNGNMTGYLLDENYVEMGCMWDGEGNFDLYIEPFMVWNGNINQWKTLFGTMFNYISPNGRYIASMLIEYSNTGLTNTYYPYVYDCVEKEMYVIRDPQAKDMLRVDCVDNDGIVYLSDVDHGYSSVPFCYDVRNQKFYKVEDFWKEKYDYEPDRTIVGTILAVSDDGKTYLAGCMEDNFTTIVYFMR
ncbi:MAG: hypothetical protein IKV28_03475 [Bacteroidales bacterium]|nr:hypothetical protein [Bacteroidales bacterium]